MYVNIKFLGGFTKTFDCTHLSFMFDRLLIYSGSKVYRFNKSKIEWFTVDKK